jgi:pimeloyl-ACP methyl ester carboxylesterase
MTYPLPIVEQHTFSYNDSVQINYEIYGQGEPRLVFLHGFGASRESWRDILPFLRGAGTLYLVDLKGHGLSSKPNDSKYSLSDQADVIATFLKCERIEPAVLVGHSYGGAVALLAYFHLRANGEESVLRGLVLIDSAGYAQSLPFFVSVLRQPVLNHVVLSMPATFRARYTLERLFFDRAKVTNERVERYARYFDLPGSHHALIECAKHILPRDMDSVVAQIPTVMIPTLIIWGENDTAIPLSIAQRLHTEVRSSKLTVLHKCGHVTQEEQPEATAETLRTFLSSL